MQRSLQQGGGRIWWIILNQEWSQVITKWNTEQEIHPSQRYFRNKIQKRFLWVDFTTRDTKPGPLASYIFYVCTPHTRVGGWRVTSARLTQCHTAVCSLWLQFALKYLPIALWGPDRGNDPGQWRWWERLGTAVGRPSKKNKNKKTHILRKFTDMLYMVVRNQSE